MIAPIRQRLLSLNSNSIVSAIISKEHNRLPVNFTRKAKAPLAARVIPTALILSPMSYLNGVSPSLSFPKMAAENFRAIQMPIQHIILKILVRITESKEVSVEAETLSALKIVSHSKNKAPAIKATRPIIEKISKTWQAEINSAVSFLCVLLLMSSIIILLYID